MSLPQPLVENRAHSLHSVHMAPFMSSMHSVLSFHQPTPLFTQDNVILASFLLQTVLTSKRRVLPLRVRGFVLELAVSETPGDFLSLTAKGLYFLHDLAIGFDTLTLQYANCSLHS